METEIKPTIGDDGFSKLTVEEKKEIVRKRWEAIEEMQGSLIVYDEEFVKEFLGIDRL